MVNILIWYCALTMAYQAVRLFCWRDRFNAAFASGLDQLKDDEQYLLSDNGCIPLIYWLAVAWVILTAPIELPREIISYLHIPWRFPE